MIAQQLPQVSGQLRIVFRPAVCAQGGGKDLAFGIAIVLRVQLPGFEYCAATPTISVRVSDGATA
jgi:hypothetical protein